MVMIWLLMLPDDFLRWVSSRAAPSATPGGQPAKQRKGRTVNWQAAPMGSPRQSAAAMQEACGHLGSENLGAIQPECPQRIRTAWLAHGVLGSCRSGTRCSWDSGGSGPEGPLRKTFHNFISRKR